MKISIFFAIATLLSMQVAAAIPHGHNRHGHIKKDLTTETITETEYVTASATQPAVIVWVDGQGNVVSTETRTSALSSVTTPVTTQSAAETTTSASAAAVFTAPPPVPAAVTSASSSVAVAVAPATTDLPSASDTPPVVPDPNTKAGPASSSSAQTSGASKQGDNSGNIASGQFPGLGIAYDILNNQGQCKNAFTVGKDFEVLSAYSAVRIYDTTCNQVQLITSLAAQHGMKVFAGISDPTRDIAGAVKAIVNQAGPNLHVIDTIAIGNEYVNGGGAVGVVTAAIGAARAALSGIYGGSIVTVDTCGVLQNNPALCAASDYCAANCHAFFGDTAAANAGPTILGQVAGVAAANPNKAVIVTESGWAWKDSTGNSRATPDQQAAAIASLRASFSSNLFLFQAFDTLYKGTNYEGYFGIYYHND